MNKITVSIDAMGGDYGPKVTIPAAVRTLKKHPDLHLILVGRQEVLKPRLVKHGIDKEERITIQHASEEVQMDELPSRALRYKKDSSMRVAINLVKEGKAQACVSSGNTGALMATARFVLKMLPGIDRPAIISPLPTTQLDKDVYALDLGANVDSCADTLYQFAVMGSVMASAVENIERPKVALLNIGEEEMKGNDQVKQTAQLLTESDVINYVGYIEGDGIFRGEADVVVCDGFVGNVAVKAAEGVSNMLISTLKEAAKRNAYTKLIALIARPLFKVVKQRCDPDSYNGSSLLGLNGIVVKSHGGAGNIAFAHAIDQAVIEVAKDVPGRIREQVGIMLEDTD